MTCALVYLLILLPSAAWACQLDTRADCADQVQLFGSVLCEEETFAQACSTSCCTTITSPAAPPVDITPSADADCAE